MYLFKEEKDLDWIIRKVFSDLDIDSRLYNLEGVNRKKNHFQIKNFRMYFLRIK